MPRKICSPWKLLKDVFKAFDEHKRQTEKTIEAMAGVTLIKAKPSSSSDNQSERNLISFRDESGIPRRRYIDRH